MGQLDTDVLVRQVTVTGQLAVELLLTGGHGGARDEDDEVDVPGLTRSDRDDPSGLAHSEVPGVVRIDFRAGAHGFQRRERIVRLFPEFGCASGLVVGWTA